jgi:hypothetical protein
MVQSIARERKLNNRLVGGSNQEYINHFRELQFARVVSLTSE